VDNAKKYLILTCTTVRDKYLCFTCSESCGKVFVKSMFSLLSFWLFAKQYLHSYTCSIYIYVLQRTIREPKDNNLDLEKLDSARKRLHENYQEIQNGNNFIDVPSCSFRFYCDEHRAKGVNID
jgi:hypothetical protein